MSKIGVFYMLCLVFLFSSIHSKAQLKQDSIATEHLAVSIDNLNFIKNNEYFNNIADGYTLLGSYVHPEIVFYPHPKARLKLGIFGLTYAGLNKYHKVIPTFSFTLSMKDAQLIMGTLDSDDKHQLISPIMAFERQLDERSVENGIQYTLHKNKFFVDSWINWEEFIFKGATKNEEFVMGISCTTKIINTNKWLIEIPFQNIFYHRGGQINTNETQRRVVFTMRNTALGVTIKNLIDTHKSLEFRSYIIQNKSGNIPQEYIFTSGYGWLINMDYHYKNWSFGVGYWYGNHYVSPKGDDMFQSVSFKTDIHYENGILQEVYRGHTEPERSLLMSTLSFEKNISNNIYLGFKATGFYQNYASNPTPENISNLITNQFDYNMGLYIKYKGIFKASK